MERRVLRAASCWVVERGWKEGTCTDGPITQPATDGTVPLVCFFYGPGNWALPLDSRDAQKEKKKEKVLVLSAFLSGKRNKIRRKKKEGNKNYKTASFFGMDGWMDGYMDGWMDLATQTSSFPSASSTHIFIALYFGGR